MEGKGLYFSRITFREITENHLSICIDPSINYLPFQFPELVDRVFEIMNSKEYIFRDDRIENLQKECQVRIKEIEELKIPVIEIINGRLVYIEFKGAKLLKKW
jgi:hypothetical protein